MVWASSIIVFFLCCFSSSVWMMRGNGKASFRGRSRHSISPVMCLLFRVFSLALKSSQSSPPCSTYQTQRISINYCISRSPPLSLSVAQLVSRSERARAPSLPRVIRSPKWRHPDNLYKKASSELRRIMKLCVLRSLSHGANPARRRWRECWREVS
jgi:hypothetical protein